MRELGDLRPTTLAIMHGSSFTGDGRQALYDLAEPVRVADGIERRGSLTPQLSVGIVRS